MGAAYRSHCGRFGHQEFKTLMGSTLKVVPKTKTLIEKVKDALNKRADLKANRMLLKAPKKLTLKR